ncbi:DUF5072 family protein [Listeria grandensis]|uniref:DUF5072 family protein n=1 Tax=Listeria grandensis TaxID=1494963 RepID=A0A7X0Y534_9LIST|nr:DUF5072 family protein [Listeria grandensis]MBC1937186.1 DUF5072 family protein [Listeria grandensis]
MLQKLSFTEIIGAVQRRINEGTDLDCKDIVPKKVPVPFCSVELLQHIPDPSKTMWKEKYEVFVHVFEKGDESSVPIYTAIKKVEEAMTEYVKLPEGYELIMQTATGVQRILTEEDGAKHAVLGYSFTVCYGFKMKY